VVVFAKQVTITQLLGILAKNHQVIVLDLAFVKAKPNFINQRG